MHYKKKNNVFKKKIILFINYKIYYNYINLISNTTLMNEKYIINKN